MALRLRSMVLLIGFIALRAEGPKAQTLARQRAYSIAGTVVSSVDNHPLQRATIDLLAPDDLRRISQTTTSDEYGHFAFADVPAGNHILRGVTQNYLPTEYDQHEGFTTGIVTGAGVDTESLTLKLVPQSVIGGMVRDETGDAVAGANVSLFRQNAGGGRLIPAGFASTDDRGRFNIARLQPGSYFLVVIATPWYAIHPQPAQSGFDQANARDSGIGLRQRIQQATGIAPSIDPALDVAYAPVFYPGTTDATAATAIALRGGESLNLSFNLSAVPAVTLTLPAIGKGGAQQFPQLVFAFHGQTMFAQASQGEFGGSTVFAGIAPGDYVLYRSPAPPGFTPYSANGSSALPRFGTPLHIGRSASLEDQPIAAVAHLRAVLHTPDGSPLPAQLQLGIFRTASDEVFTPVNAKGEVALDVPPGDYSLEAAAGGRLLFVHPADCGAKTQSGDRLHVTAGETVDCSIIIGTANRVIKGYARREGKPFAGAFVLIFPASQAGNIRNAVRDQSNLDGSFELSGLATGDYKLIAIDGGWDLDWHRPEVLARYLPGAIPVHIADSAEKIQVLHEPLPVQAR